MDTPGDFSTILSQLWVWLRENMEWSIVLGVFGVLVGLYPILFQNKDRAVAKAIEILSRQYLADAGQRETGAQEQEQSLQAATDEAIAAIPQQTEIPDAQARIQEALAAAAEGNTALAEAIFTEVEARKVADGWLVTTATWTSSIESAAIWNRPRLCT